MFDRQFSLAVVAISLLLSPNVANANEIGDTDLSVGNIRIQTTKNGTLLQTPNLRIDSAKSIDNRVAVSRTRRRVRTPIRRRPSTSVILNKKVSTDSKTTVTTTTSPNGNATIRTTTTTSPRFPSTIRTTTSAPARVTTIESSPNSTYRRTTIRNSSSDSDTVSEQSSSTSCSSGSGSTVIQSSSTTVNGRTVSSSSRSGCD